MRVPKVRLPGQGMLTLIAPWNVPEPMTVITSPCALSSVPTESSTTVWLLEIACPPPEVQVLVPKEYVPIVEPDRPRTLRVQLAPGATTAPVAVATWNT